MDDDKATTTSEPAAQAAPAKGGLKHDHRWASFKNTAGITESKCVVCAKVKGSRD